MDNSATAPSLGCRLRHFFEGDNYKKWVAAAVVLLLIYGAWARFSLPQIPLTNKDTAGYISPALTLLMKGFFESTHRNFPYPGFIWILLKASGTFTSIAIAQHLLGLASGLIFWLAWLRLRCFLPSDWKITAAHAVLGIILVWSLLLSRHPIFFEHSMRPEAIYPFLMSLHILCAANFLERSLIRKSIPIAFCWGTLMTTISIALYVLKPIWGLALVSGGIPFLIALAISCGKWRILPFAAGAAGTAAGVALFLFPDALISSSHPQPVSLLSQQLFFVHANLVDTELRRDLASPNTPPFPREILTSMSEEFQNGFSGKYKKPYKTLGFNPDDFIYGKADTIAERFFRGQPGGTDRFYRHYYMRTLANQPLRMIGKILRELGVFYRCDGKLTRAGETLKLQLWYEESAEIFSGENYLYPLKINEWKPHKDYMDAVRGIKVTDEPYQADLMMMFLSVANALYVIVLGLLLVAGFLWGRKRDPKTGGLPLLWLGLWLFSYNFAITLTVALVHSMSIQRYTDTQFALTIFSFCAGTIIFLSLLLVATQPHQARQPS